MNEEKIETMCTDHDWAFAADVNKQQAVLDLEMSTCRPSGQSRGHPPRHKQRERSFIGARIPGLKCPITYRLPQVEMIGSETC